MTSAARVPAATARPPLDLSVVIPFVNEADNVAPVLAELRAALAPLDLEIEMPAIDDGSADGRRPACSRCPRGFGPNARPVPFAQNRG